jgi:hypothetical protein
MVDYTDFSRDRELNETQEVGIEHYQSIDILKNIALVSTTFVSTLGYID